MLGIEWRRAGAEAGWLVRSLISTIQVKDDGAWTRIVAVKIMKNS